MAAPQVAEDFWALLEKSGLLPSDRLAAASRLQIGSRESAASVAKTLVQHRFLTRYQAARLLKGIYRGFFIGNYRVLEILGAGGMGLLYLAEDAASHQQVALKVLFESHRNDPGMLARFEAEGRTGLLLNHPHVARTIKLGHDDKLGHDEQAYFLVMEYVRGITLLEHLGRLGRMPWQHVCDLMMQAAEGLHHVHQKGIVHRDIKPHNLIVSAEGHLKLLDFGLAMLHDDQDDRSLAMLFGHDCLGTADYVAPEQISDSNAVDGRADIYSLGCTMIHCLTGKVLFAGSSVRQKLQAHLNKPLPQFRNSPPELENVLRRMLAKDPDERFQSALEVAQALAPMAVRQPVSFDHQAVLAGRAMEANQRLASAPRPQRDQSASASRAASWETTIPLDEMSSRVLLDGATPANTSSPGLAPLAVEIRHASSGHVLHRIEQGKLAGANLAGVQLGGALLAGMDLSRVDYPNADLCEADLRGANLRNARLANGFLSSANLTEADLSGAELTNAQMVKCTLTRAKLVRADLHHARLTGADLSEADLSGADLRMADLDANFEGANLSYADLRGANLTRANLTGANLSHANLTGATLTAARLLNTNLNDATDPYGNPFPQAQPKKPATKRWWPFGG